MMEASDGRPPTYRVTFADGTSATGLGRREAAVAMLTSCGGTPIVTEMGHARFTLEVEAGRNRKPTGITVDKRDGADALEAALLAAVNYKLFGCSVTREFPA